MCVWSSIVAIHNKNGKGLLHAPTLGELEVYIKSQSTIKMEKGYYTKEFKNSSRYLGVAIHNKNGKGLLPAYMPTP